LTVTKYGTLTVNSVVNDNIYKISFRAYVFPNISMNLLSVRKLESIGYSVLFKDGKAKIEKGELLFAVAYRKRKLY